MDLFISGLFQALISGIASGGVLLLISQSLKKNNDEVKKTHFAEKELLDEKLAHLYEKINLMEEKVVAMDNKYSILTSALYEVKEKVVLMAQKQDEFKLRLFELIQTVEKLKLSEYGRVIKK